MKTIPLTKDKYAVIDDVDLEMVSQYRWYLLKDNYAYTYVRVAEKKMTILMHRLIIRAKSGKYVDHKDGNGLNNQRKNLRVCTPSENNQNKSKYKNNTSGYKGVKKDCRTGRWRAVIKINGKEIYLGSFSDVKSAATVYNQAAKKHHKKFAVLNQI